jgi:hypothetical protein
MQEMEATAILERALEVTREDIARGKAYLLKSNGGRTDELADRWLEEHGQTIPRAIDADASNLSETLANVARAFSLRLALYQAV